MTKKQTCSSCGVAWTSHLGIAGTCKKLESARGALKVIGTWAKFRNGELFEREHVLSLASRALRETEPEKPKRKGSE